MATKPTNTKKPPVKTSPKTLNIWGKLSWIQLIIIFAFGVVLFLMVDLGQKAAANYRVQREAERLTQQVELAHHHQAELLARRSYVASDLYVEEVARKELKWAKPGETVIIILPTASEEILPANAHVPAIENSQVLETE